jgi:hypothetical protein
VVWQWRRSRSDRRQLRNDGVAPASPLSDPEFVAGLRPIPSGSLGHETARAAPDIVGTDPAGRPITIRIDSFAGPILVAFLHINCDGCDEFWRGFRDSSRTEVPSATAAAIVTKGPATVPAVEIEEAATGISETPVVMSDDAWTGYRVLGYPFFVLVDPLTRTVIGETVGFGWQDVVSMVRATGH